MNRYRFLERTGNLQGWKLLGLALLVGAITACKSEPPVATIVVVDKKMPLTEWPDSLYIANLDSILAKEPIKKKNESQLIISLNSFKASSLSLPASTAEKKSKVNQGPRTDENKGDNQAKKTPRHDAENFANQFTQALSALQSDPSNSKLYKVVESKDGEDLFQLLRRTYGAGAQSLPRFYVLSTLQSVNPGVMLEHLNAGDKVRVPRI